MAKEAPKAGGKPAAGKGPAGKGGKRPTAFIKLQIPAGAANPSPPVGPAWVSRV